MDIVLKDRLTTVGYALIPLLLLVISYTLVYIPPEYIVVVTIIVGALSQYATNQRVKDSVEIVKKWVRFDYLTTILVGIWPVIGALQPQILSNTPALLLIPVTILFAILSQFVAEKRAANSELIQDGTTESK